MILWILFTSMVAFATQPVHWTHLLEVTEKHEFYQNFESIDKPKDAWQTLFGLVYINRDLNREKDCVFLRVPGNDTGILKIKTISAVDHCEDYLLQPGDQELTGVKSIQFAVFENKLKIDMTFADYRSEKWEANLQSSFTKPEPKMSMSSSEYKAPKMIMLSPKSTDKSVKKVLFLKDGSVCHDINEDCEEVSAYKCDQCSEGWYEVPNSCLTGPKYCGRHECGKKDKPACRRGMRWQRKEEPFDCRTDSSYAYCAKGLTVHCDGKKAYCR